jgi:hypothetical protein
MPNHIVAGTSKEGRGEIVRQHCKPNAVVKLEREPQNPYDPNAIKVMLGAHHIGYLKAPAAKRYAKQMDSGTQYKAMVDSMYTPHDEDWARVSITVTKVGGKPPTSTSSARRKNYFILSDISSGDHAKTIRKHAQPDGECIVRMDGDIARVYLMTPRLLGIIDRPRKIGVIKATAHVRDLLLYHKQLKARIKDLHIPDDALPTAAIAVNITTTD